ncbi:hypothetical protein HBN50_03665 [Halobacteriovorax sp. GB3]|uniref:hypothetical protein n=1 Tax=Halobacteriovorax sp. GB3 TaxID=2719615 RepID=UPI0023610254|nr:hypothetical protein [Halobacteriovorax sp. GB3]MDD0852176.1 hypothetical protein [Halobacteriovorax sp. GB3]
MKAKGLVLAAMSLVLANAPMAQEEQHEHAKVFNPQEEQEFYNQALQKGELEILDFRFSQGSWYECEDMVTGNFSGYKCASRRQVSQILNEYMMEHMQGCVQEALDEQDGGTIEKMHIVHDGILGDRRHSPRSLHAENRAIDIRSFELNLTDGSKKSYVYEKLENREFFTTFRKCWGRVVHENNGCPVYKNNIMRTGSIGWEDKNHQHHMHTSVPYCVSGKYGSYYYNR